ncbi:hypothetical protein [Vibrio owensii]|uniref:hypothetical protein n=1 Tax=Vibrio owensii TaxID=696485 RepID=UPI0040685AF7
MTTGFSPMGGSSTYGVDEETYNQMKPTSNESPSTTSTGIDTSSTFMGDVLEMGTDIFSGSGGRMPSAGSAPRGSAPQVFRGSSGNIAQILKMFSPYQ